MRGARKLKAKQIGCAQRIHVCAGNLFEYQIEKGMVSKALNNDWDFFTGH